MATMNEKLKDWIRKDPSPARIALAVVSYNWDGGMDFLRWVLTQYDVDKSAVLEVAFVTEFEELYDCQSKADVLKNQGKFYLENWTLLSVIEQEWRKGKFRIQRFAPFGEVRRHFFSDEPYFRNNRYMPERLAQFTVLAEFPKLDPALPELRTSDLGDDGKEMMSLAC